MGLPDIVRFKPLMAAGAEGVAPLSRMWLGKRAPPKLDKTRPILVFQGLKISHMYYTGINKGEIQLKGGREYDITAPGTEYDGHALQTWSGGTVRKAAENFMKKLAAGKPKSPEFWELVKKYSILGSGCEVWMCGPLLDVVGITGRELFMAMMMTRHDTTKPMDASLEQRAAKLNKDFDEKCASHHEYHPADSHAEFDWHNGRALKSAFPMDGDTFGRDYRLWFVSINNRWETLGNVITVVGDLVQSKLDARAGTSVPVVGTVPAAQPPANAPAAALK